MAFPIPPVSPPVFKPAAPTPSEPASPAPTDGAQGAESGAGFTKAVGDALNTVGELDAAVDQASRQAATGDLESVSDFMIATSEAQLATEITVAVRDRAVAAFNDIMRMQI